MIYRMMQQPSNRILRSASTGLWTAGEVESTPLPPLFTQLLLFLFINQALCWTKRRKIPTGGPRSRGNMRLWAVLPLALLARTFAADESCMGRCENGFDSRMKCQCDSMCKYYRSCCYDFEVTCGMTTRGDTFVFAEDDDSEPFEDTTPSAGRPAHDPSSSVIDHQPRPLPEQISDFGLLPQRHPETALEMTRPPRLVETLLRKTAVTENTPISQTFTPTETVLSNTRPSAGDAAAETTTGAATTAAPTKAPDPDAVVCSRRPFDSFMQQKNGSIFAFRGEYFFALDRQSVLPGYPKLIKDVWGISGAIDAAFTRLNCQGKTYIFKGDKYWRFDNGVLDDDYPRDISVGFDRIPDHVDAAFALPAPGYNGKEKVYFFKGGQYHVYEFLHQPSHEECITMTERSPSTLFRHYTDLYYNNYERVISELFSGTPQHHDRHHFIDKDWKGLKSPVDAVMAGRMYVPPGRLAQPHNDDWPDQRGAEGRGQQWNQQYQQYGQQWDQQYGQRWGRRRQRRSPFWGSVAERGMNIGQGFAEMGLRLAERRMETAERFGREQDRLWDQDWDQDRRNDGYRHNNRGNYDSRDDGSYWGPIRGLLPVQSVYFFRGETYYRVDLRTKKVDHANPPYPRSIAKYWLGCSDTTGAEK
uniref:vitronectin a isoform X2 n=1 Tax=Gasterosteus aculeatus aculeatus TaxID=481459 RepID=UPI001A9874E1|nr:vitronectin a isoform X2 [Gasterosteus aculeatus aculeatus]